MDKQWVSGYTHDTHTMTYLGKPGYTVYTVYTVYTNSVVVIDFIDVTASKPPQKVATEVVTGGTTVDGPAPQGVER